GARGEPGGRAEALAGPGERPRDRRAEQVPEREHVRAAARAPDLGPETAGKGLVEVGTDEALDAIGGVAAALSAGDRRRFEGHGGLADGDGGAGPRPRSALAAPPPVA